MHSCPSFKEEFWGTGLHVSSEDAEQDGVDPVVVTSIIKL